MAVFSGQTWSIAQPSYEMLISTFNDTINALDQVDVATLALTTNAKLQIYIQFIQMQTQLVSLMIFHILILK